jgi:hypothetical protein
MNVCTSAFDANGDFLPNFYRRLAFHVVAIYLSSNVDHREFKLFFKRVIDSLTIQVEQKLFSLLPHANVSLAAGDDAAYQLV